MANVPWRKRLLLLTLFPKLSADPVDFASLKWTEYRCSHTGLFYLVFVCVDLTSNALKRYAYSPAFVHFFYIVKLDLLNLFDLSG